MVESLESLPAFTQAQTYLAQAYAHYDARQYQQALDCFVAARELKPDLLEAHWNECLVRLMLGDFKTGWVLHEGRWQKNEGYWQSDPAKRGFRHEPRPLWIGDFDIEGKTICLWHEQGYGDTLQFCRYVPLVQRKGAKVLLYVRDSMARLLKQSFAPLGVDVFGVSQSIPAFDAHCPMMSLGLACGTDSLEKIPAHVPYIFADPQDVEKANKYLQLHDKRKVLGQARMQLAGHNDAAVFGLRQDGGEAVLQTIPKRVGLVWSGQARPDNPLAVQMNQARSLDFAMLKPLLDLDLDIQWVSLQKQEEEHDKVDPLHLLTPMQQGMDDWADTAALVANLDLVIACDTGVAHLAAAMGKPTWILSRYNGCWRWLGDQRADSPWYPTVRLFHQVAPGDWGGVVTQVMSALVEHLRD